MMSALLEKKTSHIPAGTGEDMTAEVAAAIEFIKTECGGNPATLLFNGGEYDFFPQKAKNAPDDNHMSVTAFL